ncbi:MAG: hypothetical protein F7C33_01020 [Desulfurococcales archaeon]|nr:hypothetical protein [Desulfurococcales archaeon]
MAKGQFVKTTEGSRRLALLGLILGVIEEVSENVGVPPEDVVLQESALEFYDVSDYILYYSIQGVGPIGLPRVEKEVEVAGRSARLVVEPREHLEGIPAMALYERVPHVVLYNDSSMWKRLALDTTRTGVEYMGIYLDNGEVLVVEGERFRVRLPFVRSLASIHTHPDPYCELSVKDIESGLDLLVEGGLFEAAVTRSCASVMHRVGFVSEDDYVSVREFVLSRGRKLDKLLRLSSIRFLKTAY